MNQSMRGLLVGIALVLAACDEKPDRHQSQIDALNEAVAARDRQIESLSAELQAKPTSSPLGTLASVALASLLAFAGGLAIGAKGLAAYKHQHKEQTHDPPPRSP